MNKLDKFLYTLNETNIQLDDYVSWKKINEEIDKNDLYLSKLDYLLSETEDEFFSKFLRVYSDDPEPFKILPLLIANNDKKFKFHSNGITAEYNYLQKDDVLFFIKNSGLLENVFLNPYCKSIALYCFGLKVGLDTHSHKNKSGKWASEILETVFKKYNINFQKEVYIQNFFKENDINEELKTKIFDYSFIYDEKTYFVELNYFNSSGSKGNSEISRFIKLKDFIEWYKNKYNKSYEFMYITDGKGWLKNRKNLAAVVNQIPNCYNFKLLENDFFKK